MSVSGKNMEIVCGESKYQLAKGEHVTIPSETAGKRRVPKEQNILETQDFMTVHNHTAVLDEKGKVVRRVDENGKVLTGKEEIQKGGVDR